MRIERPQVKVISTQSEKDCDSKPISDAEQKKFLFQNYPDLYKQMYPDEVVEKKPNIVGGGPQPHQKREGQDIQQTNKVYRYDKYGDAKLDDSNSFSYNIQITTDMNIKR